MHDFSLLHDDLMDGDTERRHRPTAWTVFGADGAILAGDALLGLATQVLLEVEGEPGRKAAVILGAGVQDLVRGQAEDEGHARDRLAAPRSQRIILCFRRQDQDRISVVALVEAQAPNAVHR